MTGPWRHPAEVSDDLYPNLSLSDNVVSGSIVFQGSRLAAWAVIADLVAAGWPAVRREYLPPCDASVLSGFLYDLLEARGEFGRLLLVLAEANLQERTADADRAWWDDPALSARVVDQLRRCLAVLDTEPEQ